MKYYVEKCQKIIKNQNFNFNFELFYDFVNRIKKNQISKTIFRR